jgi:acetylornithine deacetylase/succinyl-diaminopimelate desuccinylase-like protein
MARTTTPPDRAALIELAFALAAKREELSRTVVFLSTDGEECGCTGVKHCVLCGPSR